MKRKGVYASDIIEMIIESYIHPNKEVVVDFLNETDSGMAVRLDCIDSVDDGDRREYSITNRIISRFAPHAAMPKGVEIPTPDGSDFVPYEDIQEYKILRSLPAKAKKEKDAKEWPGIGSRLAGQYQN